MNKLLFIILIFLLFNNCSFNSKSKIWSNQKNEEKTSKNIKKLFQKDKIFTQELNPNIKIDLSKINLNLNLEDNTNNFGSLKYNGFFDKIASYKYSKFNDLGKLDYKPLFLKKGIIFFDKKGSIIKYNEDNKILWKVNYYSKSEKKINPKLEFLKKGKNIIIADNISNIYSINIDNGELNWKKNIPYPRNSRIKNFGSKFYFVDYTNTLKCFDIKDGEKCWELKTDSILTMSQSKNSLIILDNKIIFSNSIGDITAVEIDTGLIAWQLPTQSNEIYNENYNFKSSQLVTDNKDIFFSNNKNQFYSINAQTGTINWSNNINSSLTPIVIDNFLFTVTEEGFLFTVQKDKGNIIRVNDIYKEYKEKKRKKIKPIGFSVGQDQLYLINDNSQILIIELGTGLIKKIEKVSGEIISKPFIFNENLFLIKNGSINKYN